MIRPKNATQKNTRIRELNLIYFIDSSRSKAIKMRISTAGLILSLSATILLWAITSPLVIYHLFSKIDLLKSQREKLSEVLFDYQIRYDRVFEKTYPTTIDKKDELSAAKTPPQTATSMVADAGAPYVSLKSPTFSVVAQSLVIDFGITNNNPEQKVNGYVWATLVLEDSVTKETESLGLPSGIVLDSSGSISNPKMATSYSIMRYKPIQLTYKIIDANKKPIQLTIHVKNKNQESLHFPFSIPDNLNLNSMIDNPIDANTGDSAPNVH